MSGGHFSYDQYRIRDIAEEVRRLVETNGKEVDGYQRPEYSQDTMNYHETKDFVVSDFVDSVYYQTPPSVFV